jgi:hypothetical protein
MTRSRTKLSKQSFYFPLALHYRTTHLSKHPKTSIPSQYYSLATFYQFLAFRKTKVASYTLALLATTIIGANAYWKGFAAHSRRAGTGGCKSTPDWKDDFNAMMNLPGNFTTLRIPISLHCDMFSAVPAAIATGGHILANMGVDGTTTALAKRIC